jgi:hypothetical protein
MQTTAAPSTDDAYLAEALTAARERGDHATVARIEHCFAVSAQVNPENDPRGSKAWQRATALGRRVRAHGHQAPKVAPALSRTRTVPRPRGAGRPRASASRSSARSGDSGESSSSEGGGDEPPPALLFIVHERYGKVSRALARHLRRIGA